MANEPACAADLLLSFDCGLRPSNPNVQEMHAESATSNNQCKEHLVVQNVSAAPTAAAAAAVAWQLTH